MNFIGEPFQIAPCVEPEDVAVLARKTPRGLYLFYGTADSHGARSFGILEVCGAAIYDVGDNGSDVAPFKLARGGILRALEYPA